MIWEGSPKLNGHPPRAGAEPARLGALRRSWSSSYRMAPKETRDKHNGPSPATHHTQGQEDAGPQGAGAEPVAHGSDYGAQAREAQTSAL